MQTIDSVIAVYEDHPAAKSIVKKLVASGFETNNLSVVGNPLVSRHSHRPARA